MPNRIIREGILTSLAVDRLTPGAELFYRRLLNVVDDFGRYHATPSLLRAACYPLKIDTVKDSHITEWVQECANVGLIRVYAVDGAPYLEVLKFGEPRAKKSKFPHLQANDFKCLQTQTNVPPYALRLSDSPLTTLATSSPVEAGQEAGKQQKAFTYPDDFEAFWAKYPRRAGKGAAFKVWEKLDQKSKVDATERAEWVAGCWKHHDPHGDRAAFIPHASTWLAARGWEDADEAVVLMARGK